MNQTLAIFSPAQNAYSETFILAHKKLPFQIKFYYNGYLPTQLEGQESLLQFSIKERIKKKLNKKFTLQQYALLYSLKREKVNCVLAEYGPTACESLEVIKYLKIPMVVHFHGYDASIKVLLNNYEKQYKSVFQYAHGIIAVSNKMKEALVEMGCPSNKIKVSVYGPDPEFFNINPNYHNQQFISIGRFVQKKAPYLTILAFKKVVETFPDARLVMVGDGELFSICKNLAMGLGIEENIEFKGVQKPVEIRNLLEQSIALVQHSIIAENGDSEGTPVALVEAQAAALPVISTRHAGIPELVLHNETGLLSEEKDVMNMAENMCTILQFKNLAKKLGMAGRERILHSFSMDHHLEALETVINKSIK